MAYNPNTIVLHDYGYPRKDRPLSKTARNPYHALVYDDGSVRYFHQGEDPYGAGPSQHAYRFNPESVGIAWAGAYGGTPSEAALKSIQAEIKKARERFPEIKEVITHGEAYARTKGKRNQASRRGRDMQEASWVKLINKDGDIVPTGISSPAPKTIEELEQTYDPGVTPKVVPPQPKEVQRQEAPTEPPPVPMEERAITFGVPKGPIRERRPFIDSREKQREHAEWLRKKAEEEDVSVLDVLGISVWQGNATLNSIRHVHEVLTPEYSVEDPNFLPDPEDMKDYEPWQQEYLLGSPNAFIYEQRKKTLQSRTEAEKVWQNAGIFGSIAGYAVGGGLDLGVGIGLGKVIESPLLATKLAQQARNSYVGRAFTYGGVGVASAAPEFALMAGSGQISNEDAFFYSLLAGGGIGGAIGVGSRALELRKAAAKGVMETAEDAADRAAIQAGREPAKLTKKPDPTTEAEVNGGKPPRVTQDATIVRRYADDITTREAVEKIDADVRLLDEGVQAARGGKSLPAGFEDAVRRQAYLGSEPMTIYVPRKGTGSSVNIGYRVAPKKGDYVEVRVPKDAPRIEGGPKSPLGLADEGTVILTGGRLQVSSKADRAKGVPEKWKYKISDVRKTPARLVAAKSIVTATGERVSSDELVAINAKLAKDGEKSDLFDYSGSTAGAALNPASGSRINPNAAVRLRADRLGLSEVNSAARKIIEVDDAKAPSVGGLLSQKAAISRGTALLEDPNPAVRMFALFTMPGLWDLRTKDLLKVAKRPLTPVEVKERIAGIWQSKITVANKEQLAEFKKLYRQDKQGFIRMYQQRVNKNFTGSRLDESRLNDLLNVEVSYYMREWYNVGVQDPEALAPVVKLAQTIDKINSEVLDHLADPGRAIKESGQWEAVAGMDGVKAAGRKPGWMPRLWSYAMIQSMEMQYGPDILRRFLKENFKSRLELEGVYDFDDAQLTRIAGAMADTIKKNRGSWHSWSDAMFGRGDPQDFIAMLNNFNKNAPTGRLIDDATMDALKSYLARSKAGAKETAGSFTHYRGVLDEDALFYFVDKDGNRNQISLGDFIENHAASVTQDYIQKASGRIANATLRVPAGVGESEFLVGGVRTLEDGTELKYGIRTDNDWEEFMDKVGQVELSRPIQRKDGLTGSVYNPEDIMQNWYQVQTNTYPFGAHSDTLQFIKMMGNIRYLGNAIFPQLGESVNMFAYGGVDTLNRIPSFPQLVENIRNWKSPHKATAVSMFTRYLMSDMGVGNELHRMFSSTRIEDMGSNLAAQSSWARSEGGRRLMYNTERLQNFVFTYGGLIPGTSWQNIRMIEALNDQFYGWATKYGKGKLPRRHIEALQNAGLSPDEIDDALEMFAQKGFIAEKRGLVKNMIEDFDDTHPGFDPALMQKLQHAFMRQASRAIQQNKWDWLPPGFDNPYVKLFAQLKSFMIASFTAQLVNNTARGAKAANRVIREGIMDGNWSSIDGGGDALMELGAVGVMTLGQMASGALMYVVLQEAINLGLSEDQVRARREDLYDPVNLLAAGISRSGWLGSATFAYDSVASFFGAPAFDGYRSSGLGSTIFDAPSLGLGRDLWRAGKSAWNMATGDPETDDARNIQRMVSNIFFLDIATQFAAREVLGFTPSDVKPKPNNIISVIAGGNE